MNCVFIIVLCIGFVCDATNKKKRREPDLICEEEGNYLIKNGNEFYCVECRSYPFGQELEEKCGATRLYPPSIDIECLPCQKGFFKAANDHSSCQACRKCANFKVKSACKDDHDTICSVNKCEDGYEFDPKLVRCLSSGLEDVATPRTSVKEHGWSMKTTEKDPTGPAERVDRLKEPDPTQPIKLSVKTNAKEKCKDRSCVVKCGGGKWVVEQIADRLGPLIFMLSFISFLSIAIFVFWFIWFACHVKGIETV